MDRQTRFLRNIAAALFANEWTHAGLRAAIERATGKRFAWSSALVKRVLTAHTQVPDFTTLLAFLEQDSPLTSACAQLSRSRKPQDHFPLRTIFRVPTDRVPPCPTWSADLPAWRTESDCAQALGVTLPQLLWLADPTGRNPWQREEQLRTYRYRWVAKPRGKARLLEVPTPLLRRTQRRLLDQLLNRIAPHPAVHGFRSGCSVVTNAAVHCGRAVVLRFDLADFFPSIPAERIYPLFRIVGYPEPVVRLLTGLCTTRLPRSVWNGRPDPSHDGSDYPRWARFAARHLPQGAPTSPALANLITYRLDRRLAGLAAACGASYTRYADDLTFSGGEELRRACRRIARRVTLIAAEEGFTLQRAKTRLMGHGERQTVTGVVVNVHPNVPRNDFDQLKAILTNCVRHGPTSQNRDNVPDFRAHLAGRVAHVAGVNPLRGRKLWAIFDRIAWFSPDPTQIACRNQDG